MRRRIPFAPFALLAIALAGGCKQQPGPAAAEAASAPPSAAAPAAPSAAAEVAEALNPSSSPKDDIKAAMAAFLQVKSFHASMDIDNPKAPGGKMTADMDFVAPDRYRMKMPMGTQTIIGDTLYMSVQGRTMKVPMQKDQLTQWRDPAKLAEHEATMTVEAQGRDTVDGAPARKYAVRNTQPQPVDMTLWLGEDGLPLQILNTSAAQGTAVQTRIRYSRYNDASIKVDPPQ